MGLDGDGSLVDGLGIDLSQLYSRFRGPAFADLIPTQICGGLLGGNLASLSPGGTKKPLP
jgi:hypothetical protein